jgi:hypothetical protein
VKLAGFRRPKAACFLSYMEYAMKNRLHEGVVTYKQERVKEGNLKGEYE